MWPQLFGWGSPTSAPGFAGGMVEYGGQRRNGLLSRARRPTLAPIEQEQMTPYTRAMPGGLVGSMGAPPPEPTMTAQGALTPMVQQMQAPKSQGWGARLSQGMSQIDPQTWFQMAGGFLDAANGDATVGQAFGGIGSALQGQNDRALQREDVDYAREQRAAERKAKADREQWIASLPPDQQALARIAPDAIVGAQAPLSREAQARIDYERSRAETQDKQWAAEMGLRQRDMQQTQALGYARLNADRFLNSQLASLGRDEAAYVAGMRSKLDTGRDVMAQVGELQRYLKDYPDVFGALLEANPEAAVRKFARGDPNRIAAIQRIYSIGANLARDELKGQAPVSNVDLMSAIRSNPNTQSVPQTVDAWINQTTAEYKGAEDRFQSALERLQSGQSLYAPDPATGRNWYQDTYQGVATPRDPSVAQGAAAPSPPAQTRSAEALPPARGLADGTTATDSVTGRRFVVRNGQWVPVGQPPRQQQQPANRRLNNGNIR